MHTGKPGFTDYFVAFLLVLMQSVCGLVALNLSGHNPPAIRIIAGAACLLLFLASGPWIGMRIVMRLRPVVNTMEQIAQVADSDYDPAACAAYYNACLAEMPLDVLEKAIRVLQGWILECDKEAIRKEVVEKGLNTWVYPVHFYWGMSCRNALRQAGLIDDRLPKKNWDDYYHQVVEIVVGARPMPDFSNLGSPAATEAPANNS